jgi:hypothetical protein
MKRVLKIVVIVAAIAFIVIQFIPVDKTNPPIDPTKTIEASMNVPPDVQQILARSCNDCHSNKTEYPWYSNIAPVSWWLKNHITEARHELNFSEWGTYNEKKKAHKLEEICGETRSHAMPLPSYLWIHRDAVLSESDIATLCNWTEAERKLIVVPE